MQIYVSKNNRQLGPFEEAQVLEMLRNGQLTPNDLGVRQGESQWQPLGKLFSGATQFSAAAGIAGASVETPTTENATGGGCRRTLGTLMIVFGILIFLAGSGMLIVSFTMAEPLLCQMANEDYNRMQDAYEKYQKDKTPENQQNFETKSKIFDAGEKYCADALAYYRFWKIVFGVGIVFGLLIWIIGFFLRR